MFLDYYATGKLDVDAAAAVVAGIAEGCRQAGCALVGGETAEMPGMYAGRRLRPGRLLASARSSATRCCRGWTDQKAGDLLIGLASSGPHSNGYSLIRTVVERSGLAWDAAAPFAQDRDPGRGADGADPHLCEAGAAADEGRPDQGRGPHHRRRPDREPAPLHRRGPGAALRLERLAPAAGVPVAAARPAASPTTRCAAPSTAASASC